MESCKKLDFRPRDVSTKIPNSFNLVSDKLALGLQLLSFSLFLLQKEREPVRGYISMSLDLLYTHVCVHI